MASDGTTPAVLYAAKSTEDKHGSIPTQLDDCRKDAEKYGWEVEEPEYADEAASAWSGNRGPQLAAAMEHVERVKGVLVAQHSDRLARGDGRKNRHLVEIALWAMKADVKVHCVQDPSTFENLIMAAVMGERNTEDSRRKSEATKAGKRRAWERGDFPGGPIPDGFERVGDERRLDPERIDIFRLIGDLDDEGYGDPSIARELNRRGLRTKGGKTWFRTRIQDVLTNPVYYGGAVWQRGTPEQEINWEVDWPALWTREDYERRMRARTARDPSEGSDRNPRGRMHSNHALAGLALCGRCLREDERVEYMRPTTSSHRRQDGSRRRTYVCRHVCDGTGLCDVPPFDAELVDAHVVNELGRYLGDFEAWQDQLLSGYANERERLSREVESARKDLADQEQIAERTQRAIGLAEDEMQTKVAMQAAAKAQEGLERCLTRLEAAQQALDEVPTEAPADSMLDFYNELSAAVRGRLEGANTIARVNDALRDIFQAFILDHPPHHPFGDGICIAPLLHFDRFPLNERDVSEFVQANVDVGLSVVADIEQITPPLRKLHAPSAELANASGSTNFPQVLPPMVVPA